MSCHRVIAIMPYSSLTTGPRAFLAVAAALSVLLVGCASPLPAGPVDAPRAVVLPSPGSVSDADAIAVLVADQAEKRGPRPLSIVSTEGRLPGDPVREASDQSRVDWNAMLALAQAARVTVHPRYGLALDGYFAAWAAVYQPEGNPISETPFSHVVMAYEIGAQYLTPPTIVATQRMFQRALDRLFDPNRVRPGTEHNNWQSHRLKLSVALAYALNDQTRLGYLRALFRQQIASNIAADGMVFDYQQHDALHYAVYSLEPLLTAALIARQHGEDWYAFTAKNGASLNQALRWIEPYAKGEKTHLEFANTSMPFDRTRRAAGVAGFDGPWNPQNAADCYALAARLDSAWIPLSLQLGAGSEWIRWVFPSPLIEAERIGRVAPAN
jgi:Alginate lyase